MGATIRNVIFSFLSIVFLLFLFVEVPPLIIDIAIVCSLALSLTVLLSATFIKDWEELKTLPSILLFSAIFRMALNIASTKKILTDGNPGDVISAMGSYVVAGSLIVGTVMFILLIIGQIVVAMGSGRMMEVSARFTLDSMPNKMIAIETDLGNGYITEEEAKRRRAKVEMQSEFMGHMDGAGKFIKGDVWVSLSALIVNIVFGLITGVTVLGLSFGESIEKYTMLTIGDGVVALASALMITLAAGYVQSKVKDDQEIGTNNILSLIFNELTKKSFVVYVIAAVLFFLALIPKMPFYVFASVAIGLVVFGYRNDKKRKKREEMHLAEEKRKDEEKENTNRHQVVATHQVEALSLEYGFHLYPYLSKERVGETIVDKLYMIRQEIVDKLGILIPLAKVTDNVSMVPQSKYQILIRGVRVGEGIVKTDHVLGIPNETTNEVDFGGVPTKDPVYQMDAVWIPLDKMREAEAARYDVIDPLQLVATHLEEMIILHLPEFLTRATVSDMLQKIGESNQVLLDEIKELKIKTSTIQQVLKNLLSEQVPIKDLPNIIEAIIDCGGESNPIDDITSFVRQKLSRQMCEANKDSENKKINVITLDPEFENSTVEHTNVGGYLISLSAEDETRLVVSLKEAIQKGRLKSADGKVVLLTTNPRLRHAISKLLRNHGITIPVMSANEFIPSVDVKLVARVGGRN